MRTKNMIFRKISLGQKYWCIKNNFEAEGYGDDSAQKPWEGVITKTNSHRHWLSRVGVNGEPDTDSNATALCKNGDLFLDRESALLKYMRELLSEIQDKQQEIAVLESRLKEAKNA